MTHQPDSAQYYYDKENWDRCEFKRWVILFTIHIRARSMFCLFVYFFTMLLEINKKLLTQASLFSVWWGHTAIFWIKAHEHFKSMTVLKNRGK